MMDSFNDFDKEFKSIERFIKIFIATIFTMIVCGWLVIIAVGYNLSQGSGIRSAVEQLWCGKSGCLEK